MKATLILLLLMITQSFCYSQDFATISRIIQKECKEANTPKLISFHKIRILLFEKDQLNFINTEADTVYIIEHLETQSGSYCRRIWNSKGSLSSVYYNDSLEITTERLYTGFTIKLIKKWDTAAIRKEEKINANLIPERYFKAIRVIINKHKPAINYIVFKEFFNLERDR
ncbi:MAG: hypothetical protein JST86_02690 [Bacteroidetes bacterium]|nr:hypothetical protein [Bacteroidota bacterium]